MTSLLVHTVAQGTKWRSLPKNLNQLIIFVIGLSFTWSRVNKNRAQFQKTNYFKKSNGFIISCSPNLIILTETKIKIIKLIFDIENRLWKSNFGDFCRLIPKWTQVQSQKFEFQSHFSMSKISLIILIKVVCFLKLGPIFVNL